MRPLWAYFAVTRRLLEGYQEGDRMPIVGCRAATMRLLGGY